MAGHVMFRASSPIQNDPSLLSSLRSGVWDICTTVSLSNRVHDKVIGLLNPALSETREEMSAWRDRISQEFETGEIISFLTPKGATIEGVLIGPRSDNQDRKAIIFALGAGGTYEKIANPEDAAFHFVKFLQGQFGDTVALLVINYEGIVESGGTPSLDNWATDLYSAYAYLRNEGYEDVLMYGHSLGGHLTLKACEKIFQKFRQILPVVDDRSFKNTQDLFSHYAGGGIAGNVVANAIAYYTGLSSTASPLPQQNIMLINATDDPTIAYGAAMTYQFRDDPNLETLEISEGAGNFTSHVRPFNPEEANRITTFIKGQLGLG